MYDYTRYTLTVSGDPLALQQFIAAVNADPATSFAASMLGGRPHRRPERDRAVYESGPAFGLAHRDKIGRLAADWPKLDFDLLGQGVDWVAREQFADGGLVATATVEPTHQTERPDSPDDLEYEIWLNLGLSDESSRVVAGYEIADGAEPVAGLRDLHRCVTALLGYDSEKVAAD